MAWSKEQKQYLADNAGTLTVKELTAGVAKIGEGKSVEAVRSMCKRMGFVPASENWKRWTGSDIKYLIENPTMALPEIAKHLGRSVHAIKAKRYSVQGAISMRMMQVTPWMPTMLDQIPEVGGSIFDISCELHNSGARVSVEQNSDGMMALYSTRPLQGGENVKSRKGVCRTVILATGD